MLLAGMSRPVEIFSSSQGSGDLFCRSAVRSFQQRKAADLQNRSALHLLLGVGTALVRDLLHGLPFDLGPARFDVVVHDSR